MLGTVEELQAEIARLKEQLEKVTAENKLLKWRLQEQD